MIDPPPKMRIIANSDEAVRLVCEACGSHRVVKKRMLAPVVVCTTCAAPRQLLDRRHRESGHLPDRRRTLPSV